MEIVTNMQNAGAAQTGPDIGFGYAGTWTMDMVFRGWAAPLSDYWSEEELNHMIGKEVVTWKDKVWAYNFFAGVHPIMYNRKHFQQVGIPTLKNHQWSWEELIDACEKLKKSGRIPIAIGALVGMPAWFMSTFGTQYLDKTERVVELVTGEESFKDPDFSQYLEKVYSLAQKGYFNEGSTSLDFPQSWELFAAQKASMTWVAGASVVREYAEAVGGVENVGLLKSLAVYGDGKMADDPLVYAKHLFITKWSRNKELAADFLRYLSTPEKSNEFYSETGIPLLNDQCDLTLWPEGSPERILASWTKKSTSIVGAEAMFPFEMGIECLNVPVQAILTGEATTEEAVEMSDEGAEKWRRENPEMIDIYREWGEAQR